MCWICNIGEVLVSDLCVNVDGKLNDSGDLGTLVEIVESLLRFGGAELYEEKVESVLFC